MKKLRITIEADKSGEGYNVYSWGVYERSSVLAGQTMKRFIDGFDTLDEARAAYPAVDVNQFQESAHNTVNHLPGPDDWDKETQSFGGY